MKIQTLPEALNEAFANHTSFLINEDVMILSKQWPIEFKQAITNSMPCNYNTNAYGYEFKGCNELNTLLSNYGRLSANELKSASKSPNTILFTDGDNMYWFGPKSGPLANTYISIEGGNRQRGFVNLIKCSSPSSRNHMIDYHLDYLLSGTIVQPNDYKNIWEYLANECNFEIKTKK